MDTILDDLIDRQVVLIGLPDGVSNDLFAVEMAELSAHRGFGKWETVLEAEVGVATPAQLLAERSRLYGSSRYILWVEACGNGDAAMAWVEHARMLAEAPDFPQLCIVMNADCAQACAEDKRLRRRLWTEFVTSLDARALVERIGRREGYRPFHMALKGALIEQLAGADLELAERLSRASLRRIFQNYNHKSEQIWAAQVSVLLPLVERQRQQLLSAHRLLWQLPHVRKDGSEIEDLCKLEIGDLSTQVNGDSSLSSERERVDWLRLVRNRLAHNEVVPWPTLISPTAIQIADFR